MFCTNCGKEIPDSSQFCEYCGKSTQSKLQSTKNIQVTIQRRKRFTNSVSANLGIDRETITDILKKLEIDENVRIEQMTAEEVASVANEINRIK